MLRHHRKDQKCNVADSLHITGVLIKGMKDTMNRGMKIYYNYHLQGLQEALDAKALLCTRE